MANIVEAAENINRSRTLNARSATIIFAAYFLSMIFISLLLDAIGGERFGPLEDFLFPIVGCAVTVFLAFVLIPRDLANTAPTGAAWVAGGWDCIMKGLVLGAFLGLGDSLLHAFYHPNPIYEQRMIEPINNMVITPGIQQLAAIVALVVLTPISEELIFRGVLYGGYRKSFGPLSAAFVTSALFVAFHFPYFIFAPIRIFPYIVMSIALLWCRLNWNAIGPAIAAHGGYNLVAVVVPSIHWTVRHYHSL